MVTKALVTARKLLRGGLQSKPDKPICSLANKSTITKCYGLRLGRSPDSLNRLLWCIHTRLLPSKVRRPCLGCLANGAFRNLGRRGPCFAWYSSQASNAKICAFILPEARCFRRIWLGTLEIWEMVSSNARFEGFSDHPCLVVPPFNALVSRRRREVGNQNQSNSAALWALQPVMRSR